MADQEVEALTEFDIELKFGIDAKDIEKNLTPRQVLKLIKEIDDEVGLWSATILLHRFFAGQHELAKSAVPELVSLTDEELMKHLDGEEGTS